MPRQQNLFNQRRPQNLIGQIFTNLTVVASEGVDEGGNALWKCVCLCGRHLTTRTVRLRSGEAKSCGCMPVLTGGKESIYRLWSNARSRARRDGLPFTITQTDIVIPERCPILGMKLQTGARQAIDASPSLDQIRHGQGYTPNNIWVISHRANTIKNNATLDELKKLVAVLELSVIS